MNPKNKALDLIARYVTAGYSWHLENNIYGMTMPQIKQAALITVDEIIKSIKSYDNTTQLGQAKVPYWEKVKQEIQNF